VARQGKAWICKARRGYSRQSKARQGEARQSNVWLGMARRGYSRQGRQGKAGQRRAGRGNGKVG
jgi:hypothetical protein